MLEALYGLIRVALRISRCFRQISLNILGVALAANCWNDCFKVKIYGERSWRCVSQAVRGEKRCSNVRRFKAALSPECSTWNIGALLLTAETGRMCQERSGTIDAEQVFDKPEVWEAPNSSWNALNQRIGIELFVFKYPWGNALTLSLAGQAFFPGCFGRQKNQERLQREKGGAVVSVCLGGFSSSVSD